MGIIHLADRRRRHRLARQHHHAHRRAAGHLPEHHRRHRRRVHRRPDHLGRLDQQRAADARRRSWCRCSARSSCSRSSTWSVAAAFANAHCSQASIEGAVRATGRPFLSVSSRSAVTLSVSSEADPVSSRRRVDRSRSTPAAHRCVTVTSVIAARSRRSIAIIARAIGGRRRRSRPASAIETIRADAQPRPPWHRVRRRARARA